MAQCRPDVQWSNYLDYDGSPMLVIKRSDPHAKEIIAGSYHVAILTCNHETNDWLETNPQASVFIYSRNVEPKHVLCLLDHTSGSLELILLTSVKKFHFDEPCMFLKDEFGRTCNKENIKLLTYDLLVNCFSVYPTQLFVVSSSTPRTIINELENWSTI